jgi:carbonic anhydrase
MSDPLIAWQRLRAGNERFFVPVQGHRSAAPEDTPTAVVFRCADATIASEMVFGQSWGSLLDVSNWGHVIDAGVLATMEYAVDALEVPLIVVLGHDECRAVRAGMRAWYEGVIPDGATRTVVEKVMSSIVLRGAGTESLETVTSAHIVNTGLGLLERSPLIARRVHAGRCGIVCAAADSETGRLRAYATVGPVGETPDTLLECV